MAREYTLPVGSGMITVDGNGKKSPLYCTSGEDLESINIPTNAVTMVLYATADMRVSEDSTRVEEANGYWRIAGYFTVPSGVTFSIDVLGLDNLYIQADDSSGTLSFMFYY